MYTYIPSCLSLPPPPPMHPSWACQSTKLRSLCYRAAAPSYLFHTQSCIYVNTTLSTCPAFSFLPCVRKSVAYVCVSIRALQIGSSVYIYALIYNICFSPSDLLHCVWKTLGSSTSLRLFLKREFLLINSAEII